MSTRQNQRNATGKSPYNKEHFTLIRECLDMKLEDSDICLVWGQSDTFDGSKQTAGAIKTLIMHMEVWPKEWSIDAFLESRLKRIRWTPEETEEVTTWAKTEAVTLIGSKAPYRESVKTLALRLHKLNPKAKRSYRAISSKLNRLGVAPRKPTEFEFNFDHDRLAKLGLKVQEGHEVISSRGIVPIECLAKGHKFNRGYDNIWKQTGCSICNGTEHRDFLSEDYFVRHPEKKVEPCYVYQVNFPQFERPTTKPGRAKDWQIRVASYPEHELYNLRRLTLYDVFKLERLFQYKFGNYRTNPEELKGNGITEGFDLSIKDKIADIIDEYESDII